MVNPRKRVLIFSLAYLPLAGGAELAIKNITDRIGDMSFDLIALRFDSTLPEREKIGNITVHRIGFSKRHPTPKELVRFPLYLNKILFPMLAFFKAVELHRRQPYDMTWAMMSYAGFPAVFFKLMHPRVPFLLTLQEGDSIEHITKRLRIRAVFPLYRLIFKRTDFVQSISYYLDAFSHAMGFQGKSEVIPNGVDIALFSHVFDDAVKKECAQEVGKKEGDVLVITTSRLVAKNGIGDLILSLRHADARVKLLVLGIGPEEERLKLLAKQYGLGARVRFVGHVPLEDIPRYLAIADVFCRPSISEGFGSSFVEAMAAGIPVIATPVGGIVDFLFDPEKNPDKEPTGLFCAVNDPKSIARAVERITGDHALRTKIVANAKRLVTEQYDWRLIAERMEGVFDGVMSVHEPCTQKILIATGIFPPDIGGPAEYAKNLADNFLQKGYEVTVLTYALEKKLPIGIRHLLFFFRTVVRARDVDFIIALDTFSVGVPSVFAARCIGKKIIIRTGGDFLWESYVERTKHAVLLSDFYAHAISFSIKEKIIYVLTKMILTRADAVVFSTTWQKDIFIKAYVLDRSHAHVIQNFYGAKIESAAPVQKNFLWAGRRIVIKNIALMEDVFADDDIKTRGVSLEIVPKVSHQELLEKMKVCYAIILPSLSEVSPNFILDALRMNKPFVMTRETGLYDVLKDEGVFFDPTDRNDIKEKVLFLSDDGHYREQQKKIADFTFTHTWEDIVKEFVAIYTDL